MSAPPSSPARDKRVILLSDTHGPLMLFENGRFKLGPGWEPDSGGRAFLAWVNATYQKELKP